MDATAVVDMLYVLIAGASLGFVVYGAWLCIDPRKETPQERKEPEAALRPGIRESSL